MYWYLFYTPWGWAALSGEKKTVLESALPIPSPLNLLYHIKQTGRTARFVSNSDKSYPLINTFCAYFEGKKIADWEVNLDLKGLPPFSQEVLRYVYTIPYGQTMTYGEVAKAIGNPRAARAVGQVLSRNPIPLIIPCHRVVARQGLGGFTAPQGLEYKKKLLDWEQLVLHNYCDST